MKPKLIDELCLNQFKTNIIQTSVRKKKNEINYLNVMGILILVGGLLFLYYRFKKKPELKHKKLIIQRDIQKQFVDYYLELESKKDILQKKINQGYQNEYIDFTPL